MKWSPRMPRTLPGMSARSGLNPLLDQYAQAQFETREVREQRRRDHLAVNGDDVDEMQCGLFDVLFAKPNKRKVVAPIAAS